MQSPRLHFDPLMPSSHISHLCRETELLNPNSEKWRKTLKATIHHIWDNFPLCLPSWQDPRLSALQHRSQTHPDAKSFIFPIPNQKDRRSCPLHHNPKWQTIVPDTVPDVVYGWLKSHSPKTISSLWCKNVFALLFPTATIMMMIFSEVWAQCSDPLIYRLDEITTSD